MDKCTAIRQIEAKGFATEEDIIQLQNWIMDNIFKSNEFPSVVNITKNRLLRVIQTMLHVSSYEAKQEAIKQARLIAKIYNVPVEVLLHTEKAGGNNGN